MHADADGDPVGRELASDDGTGDVIEEGTSCIIITTTTIHKPEKNIFKERYSRDNCILMASTNKNEAKFKDITIQSQQNKGWRASI